LFAAAVSACAPPPVNRDSGAPLGPAAQVDVDRYVGSWFEIARLPNGFEEDCEGVTAHYAKRTDGKLTVLNTCREGAPDGETRVAKGVARIVDPVSNAKLKVSFFGPFEGDYWVLERAEDYSWSLVGEPRGRYLWILAREPVVGDALKDELIGKLRARGYNTDALYWTKQPPG
jgi:apolipoprotein D and lipocalin family protein